MGREGDEGEVPRERASERASEPRIDRDAAVTMTGERKSHDAQIETALNAAASSSVQKTLLWPHRIGSTPERAFNLHTSRSSTNYDWSSFILLPKRSCPTSTYITRSPCVGTKCARIHHRPTERASELGRARRYFYGCACLDLPATDDL